LSLGTEPPPPPPPLDAQGLPEGYVFKPEYEITPRETVRRLREGGQDGRRFVLLDCRTPEEFAVARVEGAVLIPLQELAQRWEELIDEADADDASEIDLAVICHHGNRSLRASLMLRQHGFEDAMSVAGGIEAWSLGVDPEIPRY